ncbi:hypothetical protein K1T71_015253 [Dendrolimus kikuchii]|nr:hypothetical protein K1T71_015253 [Dendrolimus kikuchii]
MWSIPPTAPYPTQEDQGEWTVVGGGRRGRGRGRGARRAGGYPALTPATQRSAPQERFAPARRPPPRKPAPLVEAKAAAVMVTLLPDSIKNGLTYRQIFEQAAKVVNLQVMGLKEGLKISRTASDARLLELPPGPEGVEKADRLAVALSAVLTGVAEVARPVKKGDIRITGLDDSVTPWMLEEAIACAGGCPREQVRSGGIGVGPGGMGAAYVQCPIPVAKMLTELKHICVGFSSAEVSARERRPIRCMRCLYTGHITVMCPDGRVDRSALCFRCGRSGHRVAQCMEPNAHCVVCAESNLDANHVTLSRGCLPPHVRGKFVPPANDGVGRRQEESSMSH